MLTPVVRAWRVARLSLGGGVAGLLIVLALLRLASLGAYPLMDTTEGRYGEIARRMVESRDWITPWIADGVPFWGKPPLSFWLSAGSMRVFGIDEFAVRLPHFLMAVAIVLLAFDWARRTGMRCAIYVLPVLGSTVLFWVSAGAVMTDMVLCLGVLLSTRGFWLALHGSSEDRRRESWLFFVGLWISALAKGPVGWVLVLLPLGAWSLWTGNVRLAWRAMPWLRGGLLLLVAVVPWYLLAEWKTPGFLSYFFVGEHWSRFVVAGWQGDRYGSAHAFPRGTIWLFGLIASLPWSIVLPWVAWRARRQGRPVAQQHGRESAQRSFGLYLLMSGMASCVVFTAAGNTLWTYVLPGLPPMALWAARYLGSLDARLARRALLAGTLASTTLLGAGLTALTLGGRADSESAKAVVQLHAAQRRPDVPLAFMQAHMLSASFYSSGRALQIPDVRQLATVLGEPSPAPLFIAVPLSVLPRLPPLDMHGLRTVGDAGAYRLFLREGVSGG